MKLENEDGRILYSLFQKGSFSMKSDGTKKSCISSYRDGYHNSRSSNDDVGFKNTSEFLNMNERNELNKS